MKSAHQLLSAAFLLSIAVAAGCQKKDSSESVPATSSSKSEATSAEVKPAADRAITKVTLTPDETRTLKPGADAKLAVDVQYVLPQQGGMVGVVVQDANDKLILNVLKEVPGGAGKTEIEVAFKVPADAKTLSVHVPVYVTGEKKSSDVVVKQYTVHAR